MGIKAFELPPPGAVETRTCWLWTDGHLRGRFKDRAEVSLTDAQENVRAAQALMGGQRLPTFIDLRWVRSQSAQARDHFSSSEAVQLSPAVALLVDSPLSRAIGNFYLGFNRPGVPTRLFTDPDAAQAWLQTFTS
ncbi:MAG: hypothetical protein U0270_02690 [Labilithrix sp.]